MAKREVKIMSNNQSIYNKTKDYIKALSETDEVKAHNKAVEEFENDSVAKKLLADFQETQRTYAIFQQGGFEGVKEEEQKIRDLNDKVSKNQKIQSLIKTQQALQSLVGDLVGDISQGINFPFVQPQRGGCCG
jgi:cell fate (sporulation/competence/biofilm development) regulator YlbF (YheA/YmcA/DUF963 family)